MTVFPKVCVLVLNYNGTEDSRRCLESIEKLSYPNFDVLFIDNGSADLSWKQMVFNFPSVYVLANGANLGYAGGNNAGIRWAMERGYEDVFILNNDTRVSTSVLSLLEKTSNDFPQATLLAPKICALEDPGRVHSLGSRMNWLRMRPEEGFFGRPDFESPRGSFLASIFPGAAILAKNKILQMGDLFDEKFFLIHEDADVCLRNLAMGFENRVVADAVIYHCLSKTLSRYPALSRYYSTRNFLYLAARRASFFQKILCAAGFVGLSVKNLAILWRGPATSREDSRAFFRGALDFFKGRMGSGAV